MRKNLWEPERWNVFTGKVLWRITTTFNLSQESAESLSLSLSLQHYIPFSTITNNSSDTLFIARSSSHSSSSPTLSPCSLGWDKHLCAGMFQSERWLKIPPCTLGCQQRQMTAILQSKWHPLSRVLALSGLKRKEFQMHRLLHSQVCLFWTFHLITQCLPKTVFACL